MYYTVLKFLSTKFQLTACIKMAFTFHIGRQLVNQIEDDLKISAAPIKNRLYIFNTIYIPLIVSKIKSSVSIKPWHQQLHIFRFTYMEFLSNGNVCRMDIGKIKSDKDLPFSQVCIFAK